MLRKEGFFMRSWWLIVFDVDGMKVLMKMFKDFVCFIYFIVCFIYFVFRIVFGIDITFLIIIC